MNLIFQQTSNAMGLMNGSSRSGDLNNNMNSSPAPFPPHLKPLGLSASSWDYRAWDAAHPYMKYQNWWNRILKNELLTSYWTLSVVDYIRQNSLSLITKTINKIRCFTQICVVVTYIVSALSVLFFYFERIIISIILYRQGPFPIIKV